MIFFYDFVEFTVQWKLDNEATMQINEKYVSDRLCDKECVVSWEHKIRGIMLV